MKELISSVHEKHQAQRLPSIKVVAGLFSDNLQLLRENDNYISSEVANLPLMAHRVSCQFTLNGSQGNVTCKTAVSIEMLKNLK